MSQQHDNNKHGVHSSGEVTFSVYFEYISHANKEMVIRCDYYYKVVTVKSHECLCFKGKTKSLHSLPLCNSFILVTTLTIKVSFIRKVSGIALFVFFVELFN